MSFSIDRKSSVEDKDVIATVRSSDCDEDEQILGNVKFNGFNTEGKRFDALSLKTHDIFWFPNVVNNRFVIFVAGRSGSGKSSFVRNLCQSWQDHTGGKCYLISAKQEDPSLDDRVECSYGYIPGKLKLYQIEIDDSNVEEFTEQKILNDFQNSCVIFDDVLMSNKKLEKQLDRILMHFMKLGRQRNINIIVCRHELQDIRNKSIKEESQAVVCFPNNSFKKHIVTFCKQIGISDDGARKILNTKDRWVYIKTQYPLFALTTSEIFPIG